MNVDKGHLSSIENKSSYKFDKGFPSKKNDA